MSILKSFVLFVMVVFVHFVVESTVETTRSKVEGVWLRADSAKTAVPCPVTPQNRGSKDGRAKGKCPITPVGRAQGGRGNWDD